MNCYHFFYALFFPLLAVNSITAQSISTSYMQGKGTGYVSLNVEHVTANNYYVGTNLINRVFVFDKTEQTAMNLYGAYGVSDRLDVSILLSKVNSRGVGNTQFAEELGMDSRQEGFQDLRLMGNFIISELNFDQGSLRINGLAELIVPVGNYTVGEGFESLLAIGNNTYGLGTGLATLFQFHSDFYISMENRLAINFPSMPHAIQNQFFAGYMNKDVIIELYARNYWALSGPDAFGVGFEGIFPYTNIRRHSLGFYLCKPIGSGVVMTTGVETMLQGQNTAKYTFISLGLGYVFGQNKMKLNHY